MANELLGSDTEGNFYSNLPYGLVPGSDLVEKRLLSEYGAVFLARNGAVPPRKIVFRDEWEVREFQEELSTDRDRIGGFEIELQAAAMADLRKAIREADEGRLSITPRGSDSGRRSYDETVGLWASRVEPALKHWVVNGRLAREEADRINALSPFSQVAEILRLEEDGIFFAKDLSRSIVYSVAPPGTSQHLSMLAFDVKEFDDARIRAILARHRWYQTVVSDLPHFTYLGVDKEQLPLLGLKRQEAADRSFWIPDI